MSLHLVASIYSLEEVTLRVRRVDTPPVVDEHVEDGEHNDKECRRPLGLEADSNHYARDQTNDRNEDTSDAPLALDHETQEEENE